MHPSDEEIKIVEKIKFWEEQEKINAVLVERLLHLNKEMAIIIGESELNKKQLVEIVSRLEEFSKEKNLLRQMSSQSLNKNSELEKKLISINKYIERQSNQKNSQTGEIKKTQGTGIRAIHVTFILSILAIVLNVISLLL
ncbi:hypothetical protein [Peribacillus frigoritolerans]|uniref:hypothetical protein n=1 Tax=Peribacillus frigoritolerans TaxID=450367 RepID=UPI00215A19AE|nr:hypothetical protein [Peribacillus frigoritolerans]MCR8870679.1 hypothetical protein [Peribacillus frigoritolerans]MCY8935648.1 hypothetical protein [Peribacillus frigoritolerans]